MYCPTCQINITASSHICLEEKVCVACGATKKIALFPVHSSSFDGHRHTCNDCLQQGKPASPSLQAKQKNQLFQHKAQKQAQRETRNTLLAAFGYQWKKEWVEVADGFDDYPESEEKWVLHAPTGEAIEIEDALQEICLLCQPKPDHESAQWAENILTKPNVIILDTETTGLDSDAEIIDIAIVDKNGRIRLDTLIECQQESIPLGAYNVHHIHKHMLRNAPAFPQIWVPKLIQFLSAHEVVIYNAEYDLRILRQTAKRYDLELPDLTTHCLMKRYSAYVNQPSAHNQGYRNLALSTACLHFGIEQTSAHRALADAQTTCQVLHKLAEHGKVKR